MSNSLFLTLEKRTPPVKSATLVFYEEFNGASGRRMIAAIVRWKRGYRGRRTDNREWVGENTMDDRFANAMGDGRHRRKFLDGN
jgi:hypothetical protein